MSDVQRATRGRRNVLTDDGGEEFEYREYVPAEIADKLLAALVRIRDTVTDSSHNVHDSYDIADSAINDATKE